MSFEIFRMYPLYQEIRNVVHVIKTLGFSFVHKLKPLSSALASKTQNDVRVVTTLESRPFKYWRGIVKIQSTLTNIKSSEVNRSLELRFQAAG